MSSQGQNTVMDYDSGYDDLDEGMGDNSSQAKTLISTKNRRRAAMYSLTTQLNLDETFVRHYNAYQDDLEQFLDDHTDVHTARTIRRAVSAEPQANIDRKLSLAALACFDAAQILDLRHKFDTLRKAFLVLAIWDVFVYLQVSHNIKVSTRPSKTAVNLLVNTRDSSLTLAERKALRANITTMIGMGRRIDNLCERFGEGSLFYVAGVLSENFLMKKYRMSGPLHDDVFYLLEEEHELKQAAIDSGMQAFGVSIRKQLKGVYLDGATAIPSESRSRQARFPSLPQWSTDGVTNKSKSSRNLKSFAGTRTRPSRTPNRVVDPDGQSDNTYGDSQSPYEDERLTAEEEAQGTVEERHQDDTEQSEQEELSRDQGKGSLLASVARYLY